MLNQQETVLIVDDEAAIRKLLIRKLSREGYRCKEASTAEEALNRLESSPIELVILDIKMPGKSGIKVLPEIKARYPDKAVIMGTADTEISIAIQCLKQGADDYICKPFNLDGVTLSVQRALEKRRLVLELKDYHENLEQKVEEQAKKIRAAFVNAIAALANALEARDKYTSGHSLRVAETSVATARNLGLPPGSVEKIRLAGLVHDIGKIGVREDILNKPGKLTSEEYQNVQYHCEIGEHILSPVMEDNEILQMVRHHHERYDGNGYPDGLSGEQIPLGARILAVADTYDAMTSERPYRRAMETEVALVEIERNKGSQFDPEVADALFKVKETFSLDIITARTRGR